MLIITILTLNSCCDFVCERHKYAEDLIEQIEKYRTENKKLPDELSQIGFTEKIDSPAFYQKINETEYEVWYGIGFESNVYSSRTKKWTEKG